MIGDLNEDVDDKKDAIIVALIGSAENIVSESDARPLRDAGLLATAQKIEHYEIASYGSARD
jgi:ferritin-like metal-binding protein YciE